MADGKREHEFDVAVSLAVYVRKTLFERFNPREANPYRKAYIPIDNRTEAQKKADTKEGMAALRMGLSIMVGQRQGV